MDLADFTVDPLLSPPTPPSSHLSLLLCLSEFASIHFMMWGELEASLSFPSTERLLKVAFKKLLNHGNRWQRHTFLSFFCLWSIPPSSWVQLEKEWWIFSRRQRSCVVRCVSDRGNVREQAWAAPRVSAGKRTLAQKGIVPSKALSVHLFYL